MEAMREAWTDDRLDDLANRMERGFDRVDTDIRELRAEFKAETKAFRNEVGERFDKVDERFDKVDEKFAQLDERFERIHTRLDSLLHVILAAAVAVTVASIAGIATVVSANL